MACKFFQKEFAGYTLTEVGYAGDEVRQTHTNWAERIVGDAVIVLTSSFDVEVSGEDSSLEPDSTYTKWMWILARKNGGQWEHVDHGC